MRAVLDRYRAAEFAYGQRDCALFVCDVVRDLTGVDYAAPWRGQYQSEFGAGRIIAEHGGFEQLMCAAFGGPLQPMDTVRDGFPVLMARKAAERDSIGAALGVWSGGCIVQLCDRGLIEADGRLGTGCWHV